MLLIVVFGACSSGDVTSVSTGGGDTSTIGETGETNETGETGEGEHNGERPSPEVSTYMVGSERVTCTGAFEQTCYLLDGLYFYDPIEGFDDLYKEGCEYEIKVEKRPSEFYNDEHALGGDAPRYRYSLVELVKDSCNDS